MESFRFRTAFISNLALFIGISVLLCACSKVPGGAVADTLRMNIGAEPPSLDSAIITDSTSFDVVSNLMVGLTQYQNDLKCHPACAKNWEILDNGRRYIFHLRDDLLWSDGKPVTAHDFEYAWKRLLNPKTGSQYAYFLYPVKNAFEYNTGLIKDASSVGATAIDDHTFAVELKKPAYYFIYLTAFCPTLPQRKDVIEKWQDRWTEPGHIVTNGPFMLDRWFHEYKIELIANPHYFEGAPKLKRIKMLMIPEQATACALFENNELDYVDNRSFSTADVERYAHSVEYKNFALLRNNYIGFNVTKAPFNDVRVRRAIALSIDRSLFPKILKRHERPISSWIPPTLLGGNENSDPCFDPIQGRKLLIQAGYPGGKNFPRVALLYPTSSDTRLVVETVQDQLKRNLGIYIDLENQEWKVYLETLHRDPPPIYRASWGADYPDPQTFMDLFTSHNGNNNTRWKSTIYDELIEQASGEQDTEKRAASYRKADEYLCYKQVPIVPIYLSTQNILVKPWVEGIEFNALDIQFFNKVYIDPRSY